MPLNINITKKSKQFNQDSIKNTLETYFSEIANEWWKYQLSWNYDTYKIFKDHNKLLIVIYLIKKSLDTHTKNFQKYSISQFYSEGKKIELEKFKITEISSYFGMPKETTRRKLIELEKSKLLIKSKKKILLDISIYNFKKSTDSVKKISSFLSKFSQLLKKNELMDKVIETEKIIKHIEKNFTYCWKLYYDLQLEILNNWKNYFGDLESYNIWGLCVTNKSYNTPKQYNRDTKNYSNFIIESGETGLNALTISDMTGIPRATVVRKLTKLIKTKNLIIDNKKRYHPSGVHMMKMRVVQNNNINKLSIFITKIFNQLEN